MFGVKNANPQICDLTCFSKNYFSDLQVVSHHLPDLPITYQCECVTILRKKNREPRRYQALSERPVGSSESHLGATQLEHRTQATSTFGPGEGTGIPPEDGSRHPPLPSHPASHFTFSHLKTLLPVKTFSPLTASREESMATVKTPSPATWLAAVWPCSPLHPKALHV